MTSTAAAQDALTVRTLRRGVGVVAIALPLLVTVGNAVWVGAFTLLSSISGSYYTQMRDVFVGSLCVIGVFLICYRYAPLDDRLSSIAGVLAIIVALFPTPPSAAKGKVSNYDTMIGVVHLVAGGLLFLLLAGFCFFLFTRTQPGVAKDDIGGRKRLRNRIYVACGWAIILGLGIGIVGSVMLPDTTEKTMQPLFWGEAVAVLAFGFAWFVKGETIAKDKPQEN